MIKHLLIAIVALSNLAATAQTKMRPVNELINTTNPGWPVVKDWIESAKNKVEILTADSAKAKDALFKTQVTTRSPMGSVVYMTGGILVDDGWIRILGSGNPKLNRTLPDWNKEKSIQKFGEASPFLLVADDAIGGFYLLNGGGLGKDLGKIYYFSPDNLTYEPLDLTYSDFLQFCFNNDLDKFYKGKRWNKWRDEVSKLEGDKVISFYPTLWSKEGKNINKNTKKVISIEEQYNLNIETRKQLGLDK
ncbi:hypothetical protein SRABI27_02417 [Pedobacter sp. Bi27]|uniref:DUF2625 domain-containing protein n=1 Tax=unclassified Pedobacter TaxID=2628915 RepID=UPI001D6E4923|nr:MULTISPECIES: DUF2625 domain-containing protein [unclassified Pedobacter]CAH0228708.1 hypothetical protein SRABI27_02417 [Pedobacter sp. Bi27]CAH0241766.1 hypothetical protein SRABI36_02988 [Pedobacter sp. Bi36]CAH0267723.1 hypothetical protein SRABI126_03388 [Pedobacter sp. Bi126]